MSDSELEAQGEHKDEKFDVDEENTIKVLVATDIHLGYEQTTKRLQEDDSFRTFEEILQYAEEYQVDCILLAGDLFHETKPSSAHMTKCISLIRQYCLGSRPVQIQFLTDPELIFDHCDKKVVNYEDPNLNVSIPIFSIHGNHDDLSAGTYGSLDLLASTGLVNYFGKWKDVTEVTINPLILQKGTSKVAFYGLSYMNDQRLSRILRNDKMYLNRPKDMDDICNVFVFHQNRARHSKNAFVPENSLPDFLDLVIWGHEHECRIIPEQTTEKPYEICQPGSSVATSLAKGESNLKHIGLLEINTSNNPKYKLTPLRLKTVRPFVFHDLILNDVQDELPICKVKSQAVEQFIDKFIEDKLIADATKQLTDHPQQPIAPLIRLRIFYSEDTDAFEPLGLAHKYVNVVANPHDMIILRKCSEKIKKIDLDRDDDLDELSSIFNFSDTSRDWNQSVQGGISEYFKKPENLNKLTVLSLPGLNEALMSFVEANNTSAIQGITKKQINETVKRLMESEAETDEEIREEIMKYRDERLARQKEEEEETRDYLQKMQSTKTSTTYSSNEDVSMDVLHNDSDEDHNDTMAPPPATGRGRGRGRGRGAAAGNAAKPRATRARGRGKTANQSILDF